MAVVGVVRAPLLAASETFIRNQVLALTRHEPLFIGDRRVPGLPLPAGRVVVAQRGGRMARALRRDVAQRLRLAGPQDRLVAACRARGVRLLHAHFGFDGLYALPLAERLGVPLVVTFHGYDAMASDAALREAGGSVRAYLERREELFARAALLLAVSRPIAEAVVGQGAPPGKVRVLHNGVPLDPPPRPGRRRPDVLFVGRHVEKKGLDDLLDAMALVERELPQARLLVVGDGPLRERHERRARELGLRALFLGWRPPEEVARMMDAAGALAAPSRRAADGDGEGLPMVVLEALGRCLPVVATRHSGIPEAVVDGDTGLLADERDVAGLAAGLRAVLGDAALGERLGAAGRRLVEERFELRRQTAALEDLYDELLGGSPPVRSSPAGARPRAAGAAGPRGRAGTGGPR